MQSEDTVLLFDNYADKKQIIPIVIDEYHLNEIRLTTGTEIRTDLNKSLGLSIQRESVLFNFFCEQDIINGRFQLMSDPDSVYTRDAGFVRFNTTDNAIVEESIKLISDITLIGKLDLHKGFNSILIQVDRSANYHSIEDLYLINYKDLTILSIARIAYLFQGETVMHGVTYANGTGTFSFHDIVVGTNMESDSVDYNNDKFTTTPIKVDYTVNGQGKFEL